MIVNMLYILIKLLNDNKYIEKCIVYDLEKIKDNEIFIYVPK
jgi:cell division protein FtsB